MNIVRIQSLYEVAALGRDNNSVRLKRLQDFLSCYGAVPAAK